MIASRWAYAALLLVAVGSLALGSRHEAPPTSAQRITHLESIIKCPGCADLNIAQSNLAASAGLRTVVAQRVRGGQSDAEIEAYVVKQYGSNEILAPHGSSGWIAVALPIALFVLAATAIVVSLVRRRSRVEGGADLDEGDLNLVTAALADRRSAP